MGIYLGQLPPAEIARLKAELAETIIANFCYPRFFDNRSESLRMRPVDRAKRQEVWLYLSSVDFTAWNRVDLMSPEFQRYIERLFIQFVQRNRSFFGEQGRKRMPDVRMLITSCSSTVVQGLRSHITGQRQDRQGLPPFGSPRPAVSWATLSKNGHPELNWEQIAASSTLLQQQLQEVRGEAKLAPSAEAQPPQQATNGTTRRVARPATSSTRQDAPSVQSTQQRPLPGSRPAPQKGNHTMPAATSTQASKSTAPLNPASLPPAVQARIPTTPASPAVSSTPVRKQEMPEASMPIMETSAASTPIPVKSVEAVEVSPPTDQARAPEQNVTVAPTSPMPSIASTPSPSPRELSQASPSSPIVPSTPATSRREVRDNAKMLVGEDDIAIFEQMRHQLIIWLRVEAIHAGLEIAGQGPSQLLEMLRQQSRFDETRLQVVSTLLNLSNQVIKNGQVSVLDYKQALMFHLMHTRR